MHKKRRKHLVGIAEKIGTVKSHLEALREHPDASRKVPLSGILSHIEDLKKAIETLRDEEVLAYEILPEKEQMSDQGDAMEEAAEALTRAVHSLDEAIEGIHIALIR